MFSSKGVIQRKISRNGMRTFGRRNQLSLNGCVLRSTTTTTATESIEAETRETCEPRHPSEIPGFRRFPILGSLPSMMLHKDYDPNNFPKILKGAIETYGPIVRFDTIKSGPMVLISQADDVEAFFRSTNDNPIKRGLTSLKYIRVNDKDNYFDKKAGILGENGEEWKRVRSKVQTPMMRPKNIVKYLPQVDEVAKEFTNKIDTFQKKLGEMPPDFLNELYKWALESICLVTLSRRLGCLDPNLASDSFQLSLLNSINHLFSDIYKTEVKVKFWKLFPTPALRSLAKNHHTFLELADKAISETEKSLKEKLNSSSEDEFTLMETLLRNPGLTRKDVVVMVLDLIFAGVDTTSHTLAFALYLLAKNPTAQQRLQREVDEVIGEDTEKPLTESHLKQMSYMKACLKETLRLFPLVPGTVRVLQEDLILSGYRVPKGWTVYSCHGVTCKDDSVFPRGKEFIPERWARDKPLGPIHPFASLPFAHGTRMCIGRRIVEQELYVILARIMQRFKVDYKYGDVNVKFTLLATPVEPLKFHFTRRRKQAQSD